MGEFQFVARLAEAGVGVEGTARPLQAILAIGWQDGGEEDRVTSVCVG